jgi:hypothetical protein
MGGGDQSAGAGVHAVITRCVIVALVLAGAVSAAPLASWWAASKRAASTGTDLTVNLRHYWDAASGGTNDLGTGDNDISTLSPWTINNDGYTNVSGSSGQTMALRTAISNGSAYTISLWFNADKTTMDAAVNGGWMVTDRGGGNDFQLLYYKLQNSILMEVWTTDGNVYDYCAITNWLVHRQWQHVCVVIDGATGTLYTNGVFFRTNTFAGKTPRNVATTAAVVGNAIVTDAPWRGILDKVRIYSDAKSASFVADIFATEKGSKGL